jgi:hypothetical protein
MFHRTQVLATGEVEEVGCGVSVMMCQRKFDRILAL